jgi:hypothetical protein
MRITHDRKFWWKAVLVSIAVHSGFCLQALSVAAEGGMARSPGFLFLFGPHFMLMFFLPPPDPFSWSGGAVSVDWLRFAGKLLVAYPASLLYGCIVSALWYFVRSRPRHANTA